MVMTAAQAPKVPQDSESATLASIAFLLVTRRLTDLVKLGLSTSSDADWEGGTFGLEGK